MPQLFDRLKKALSALTPERTPAQALLERLRERVLAQGSLALNDETPERAQLLAADGTWQAEVLVEAVRQLGERSVLTQFNWWWWSLPRLVNALLAKKPPLTSAQATELLRHARDAELMRALSLGHLLQAVERVEPREPALLEALGRFDAAAKKTLKDKEYRKLAARIQPMLGLKPEMTLESGGPFGELVLASASETWRELFQLGFAVTGARPSAKWQAQARAVVEKLGHETFVTQARAWLAAGPVAGATGKDVHVPEADVPFHRALVFAAGAVQAAPLAGGIAEFALACFRKIPNRGPVGQASGNACLWALGEVGLDGVGQLGLLKMRVKYTVALRLIEKALADAAARAGLSPADLEEIGVPTFDLEVPPAPGLAHVELVNGTEVKVVAPKGSPELKALKRRAKDIEAMLGAQRLRLERLYLTGRSWPYETWRSRLLEHPLLAGMVQRLVWQADGVPFLGARGAAGGEVTLWHPLDGAPLGFTVPEHAPFKQVDRETFTMPEGADRTQQFAGRRIKQHQFAALCRERGWQFRLQGEFDSMNNAVLVLPQWGLTAELEVAPPHATGTSSMGIYLEVETGDVVLQRDREVPARVVSEVLRDVALFAGE
ncbi:MAG: DUF4132 domain-containing protein [Myxococcaceae bacterium]|nr:DUF4132 domain-containing protein [Myxococcaceae bacterium]